MKRVALGTHRVPHVLWLMVSRTGSLLEGRKERCGGWGGQESPMRDGCWPGPPAPQLDGCDHLREEKHCQPPQHRSGNFLESIQCSERASSAVLKSTLPKGKKKSDNCHSNSDLMLVLQKAEQRGKKKKAWMKSCYGGAKGFSRITPLILANALHAHFTEKKTKAQEG